MDSFNKAQQELNLITERLRKSDQYFTIVFCGVFSSGKTSLLNEILNYPAYQLPTGIKPITKLVTHIRYGERLSFFLFNSDQTIQISKDEFDTMVQGGKIPRGTTEIGITIPAGILEKGVELIDTPGFQDEMGGRLEWMSRNAVMKADYVVFCANALQLGTRFEKEYIDELEESIGNFCMVVNRMDNLHDEEVDSIYKRASFLMKNKGGHHSGSIAGDNSFFSVAAGRNITLGGFDRYLYGIMNSQSNKREISRSTKSTNCQFRIQNLIELIQLEIQQLQDQLTALQKKHSDMAKKYEIEKNISIMDVKKQVNRVYIKCLAEIDRKTDIAIHTISGLSTLGSNPDCPNRIVSILKELFLPIGRESDALCPGKIRIEDKFAASINRLPIRGLFKEKGNAINASLKPAIQLIQNQLVPDLQNEAKKVLRSYPDAAISISPFRSGHEQDIDNLNECIMKWKMLLKEASKIKNQLFVEV